MDQHQIGYRILDNALGWIADFEKAQRLADEFRVEMLHRKLDEFADHFCPVLKQFELTYHWSLDEVEFATDTLAYAEPEGSFVRARETRVPRTRSGGSSTRVPRSVSCLASKAISRRFMSG